MIYNNIYKDSKLINYIIKIINKEYLMNKLNKCLKKQHLFLIVKKVLVKNVKKMLTSIQKSYKINLNYFKGVDKYVYI